MQQKGMRNAKQTIPPYSYQKISPNLGQYLNIFFDNYSNLKVIMQNFSVAYTGKNYVENLFLDASLNLEVLYREFFDEKDQMEDEVLKAIKLVEKSLETVDDALKNKVVSRLKSLNNTSLRKRIIDLLRDVSSNLLSKIDLDGYKLNTGKGKRDFAETCANTRNFFTHGSSNHKLNPFSSSELIKVSKILNMISEYHSMTIIGLEEETINEAISRNNYYQYIMK